MEIKANPHATSEEIGASLSISSRMVRKYIAKLREHNIIERIGGNKTGSWIILKK
jgi:predicted HTH transcriptional regulator